MLLHVLWGILFGYLFATVNFAITLVNKGYKSLHEIPNKEG